MIESRQYQLELAAKACQKNIIVVLPTGSGKTAVALHVMRFLSGGRILVMAPTKVLVNQHARFFSKEFDNVAVVTGEDAPKSRSALWTTKICCATPQTVRNDLKAGILDRRGISLAVFDEVHHATGRYAYTSVARMLEDTTRLLGLTATLTHGLHEPGVLAGLGFDEVVEKRRSDADVSKYLKKVSMYKVPVRLPPEMASMTRRLSASLDRWYEPLRASGLLDSHTKSLKTLVRLSNRLPVQGGIAVPLFNAMRVHHMKNRVESHGLEPFIRLVTRTFKKTTVGIQDLRADPDVVAAYRAGRDLFDSGTEHPKLAELGRVVRGMEGGGIVFSSYRDSVTMITKYLAGIGVSAVELTGKAGKAAGAQGEAVAGFSSGRYDVLVATHVGEEGLDIAEARNVVFYDCPPDSIRIIQRIGRTGRTSDGRVHMMVTENTIDEGYYWNAKKIMAGMGIRDLSRGRGQQTLA